MVFVKTISVYFQCCFFRSMEIDILLFWWLVLIFLTYCMACKTNNFLAISCPKHVNAIIVVTLFVSTATDEFSYREKTWNFITGLGKLLSRK